MIFFKAVKIKKKEVVPDKQDMSIYHCFNKPQKESSSLIMKRPPF